MHVIQLGPYPPPEGGINRNILAIREDLRRAGHRCSIMATSRSSRVEPEPDVYHPTSAVALLKLLLTLKYDVLHLHVGGDVTARVLLLLAACGLIGRGKNVFSLHSGGYPLTKAGRAAKPSSLRGWLFRRFERLIAVNPSIAEVFERYGIERDKIHEITPFVPQVPDSRVTVPEDLERFASRHSPFILTVGLLEAEYDLEFQIDTLGEVLDVHPNAGLMIIGEGSLHSRLKAAIEDREYKHSICLAGNVDHAVTLHLIAAADMLLRTTLYDGDAISVREALFLGTSVIATDNGMRPAGIRLIDAGDKVGLVSAIVQMAASKVDAAPQPMQDGRANILAIIDVYEQLIASRLNDPRPTKSKPQISKA